MRQPPCQCANRFHAELPTTSKWGLLQLGGYLIGVLKGILPQVGARWAETALLSAASDSTVLEPCQMKSPDGCPSSWPLSCLLGMLAYKACRVPSAEYCDYESSVELGELRLQTIHLGGSRASFCS